MDYKRLYDKWKAEAKHGDGGNIQERIAKAKGVNRATVALRLQWAEFPEQIIKTFVKNDFLREGHAAEISKLLDSNNLAPWLTRESAMLELVSNVVGKHKKTVTAAHFSPPRGDA